MQSQTQTHNLFEASGHREPVRVQKNAEIPLNVSLSMPSFSILRSTLIRRERQMHLRRANGQTNV